MGDGPLPRLAWMLLLATAACNKNNGGGDLIASKGEGQLSPDPLDGGDVPVGDTVTGTLTITNVGSAPLGLVAAFSDGGLGVSVGSFGVASLNPQTQATATVSLTAIDAGDLGGTLSIVTSPIAGLAQVLSVPAHLRGIPIDQVTLEVTPSGLDFGQVQIGQRSEQSFLIHNTNGFPVQVVVDPPDGGEAGDFAVETLGAGLDYNGSQTVKVGFVPASDGPEASAIGIAACQRCPRQAVTLAGTGVNAGLTFSPPNLDFGFVENDPPLPPVLGAQVSFAGDIGLTVDGIELRQSSAFRLAQLPSLPVQFFPADGGPAQSFGLAVGYSPSALPAGDSDRVVVRYHLANGTHRQATLPLVGNLHLGPCHLAVEPVSDFDFGLLAPGVQASQTLNVTNVGDTDCQLTGLGFLAGSDPAFSLAVPGLDGGLAQTFDGGAVTVLAHGVASFPVTFSAPHDYPLHQLNASLLLTSSDPALPSDRLFLTGAVASAYLPGSAWPKWQHDNLNSGQSELDTSGLTNHQLWRASLLSPVSQNQPLCQPGRVAGYYQNGPSVGAENVVYQLGCDGLLHGYQAATGISVLALPLPEPKVGAYTTPVIGADGLLNLAYDTEVGIVGYQLDAGLPPANGIDGGSPGDLLQIDPRTAKVLWTGSSAMGDPLGFGVPASSVTSGPTFDLLGEQRYSFFGLAQSGGLPTSQLLGWVDRRAIGQYVVAGSFTPPLVSLNVPSPVVDDQGRSFWCSQGSCLATDHDLTPLWYRAALVSGEARAFHGSATLAGGALLYLAFSHDVDLNRGQSPQPFYHGVLLALDPSTGATLWTQTLSPVPVAPPSGPFAKPDLYAGSYNLTLAPSVALGGRVLVPWVDGLYCFSLTGPQPGTPCWPHLPVKDGVLTPASLGREGTAYVGTASQGLLAVDTLTGALRWQFKPPAYAAGGVVSISSSPAIAAGSLFFTADDGYIYALQ